MNFLHYILWWKENIFHVYKVCEHFFEWERAQREKKAKTTEPQKKKYKHCPNMELDTIKREAPKAIFTFKPFEQLLKVSDCCVFHIRAKKYFFSALQCDCSRLNMLPCYLSNNWLHKLIFKLFHFFSNLLPLSASIYVLSNTQQQQRRLYPSV